MIDIANVLPSPFALEAAALADNLKSLRSAAVTAENKGDKAGRSLLAAMLNTSTALTRDLAVAAIIHSFGNPKRANGKAVDSLRQLDKFTGGGAVRKMAETVFRIVENVDADSEGAATIRPAVVAYVLNGEGAAKSLNALLAIVSTALAVETKRRNGGDEATPEPAESNEGTTSEGESNRPASLADYLVNATTALAIATPTEIAAVQDEIAAMMQAAMAAIRSIENENGEEIPAGQMAA